VSKTLDNFDPDSKIEISFKEARTRLRDAMSDLQAFVANVQDVIAAAGPEGLPEPLLLDNEGEQPDEAFAGLFALAPSAMPKSVPLDALTVVDDNIHFDRIEAIEHLPPHLKKLRAMY
jgi:hypothetical protein